MKAKFELRSTPNASATHEIVRAAKSLSGVTFATVNGDILEAEFDLRRVSEADIEKAVCRSGFSLSICGDDTLRDCRESLKSVCIKARNRALASFVLMCVALYLASCKYVELPIVWWLDDDFIFANVLLQGVLALTVIIINFRTMITVCRGKLCGKTVALLGFIASLAYSVMMITVEYFDAGFSSPMISLTVIAFASFFETRKTRDIFCKAEENCDESTDIIALCGAFSKKKRFQTDSHYIITLIILILCSVAVFFIFRTEHSAKISLFNAVAFASITCSASFSLDLKARKKTTDIITPQNAADIAFTTAKSTPWAKIAVLAVFPFVSAVIAMILDAPTLPLYAFILASEILSLACAAGFKA